MSEILDISDEEMLARLAACDLTAAERVHAKLMAAEDASDIAELGRTYQRIARSLRQTLALKARFKREREAADKDGRPAKAGHGVTMTDRLRETRAAVRRVIWTEAEGAEAADYEETLDDILGVEILLKGFCDEPLDDQVVRVCLELELSTDTAARWRDLPDPPAPDTPPDPPPGDGPDFDSSD